jgi:hypothetical protein
LGERLSGLASLNRHDFFCFDGLVLLGQTNAQQTFVKARLYALRVNAFRQINDPFEGAIVALGKVLIALFIFALGLLLAANNQATVGQFDLDILLIHARQLGS